MRRISFIFLAVVVIAGSFVSMWPMPAAAAPSEQEQLAALVSQVETLTRLFETLKRNFIKPARAAVACADGIDNDNDGAIDYPSDTGCYGADDQDEAYYSTTGSTSSSSGSYSSCSSSLISLLGTGCHQMYTDASGNAIYCNGEMTVSAKSGETATTSGCSSGGSSSTPTTTSTGGTASSTPTTTTSTGGTTTTTARGSANLTVAVSGADVTLTWTDFYQGEDIYRVDRRIGAGEWIQTGTIPYLAGGSGSYKDTGVGTGTYDYRVRPCTNTAGCFGESNTTRATVGGTSTSTTAPATATPPPVISAIAATYITSYSANITWTTDIPSNAKVEYGVGTPSQTKSNVTFSTNHNIYLDGLTASTTYAYNVISENTDYYRTTFSGKTFTTSSVGGSTSVAVGSCDSALTALLGSGCHQMYTDASGNAIYCNGDMTQSAKRGDTVVASGCNSSGSGSTNANGVSHTWRFKNGSTQHSQILSRTDAEYTAFIVGVDSSAAGGYFGGWKPGAGTDANWQEFGIPIVSPTSTGTIGTWQCSDGIDNDNDGATDYPQDTSCYGRDDNDEWYPTSGGQTASTTLSGIPAAPTALTAVQSFADVLLSWQDNATNEDMYKIEWHNGTEWIVMGSTGIVYERRGTYTDRSPSQRTHQYRVRACSAAGCSLESNIALILVSGSGIGTTTPITAPALWSLTPSSGSIGVKVLISGSGFTPTGNRINVDTGVIMDVPSLDSKTLIFAVPEDRVPLCAVTEPRCLLPAPYNPVKPGTYWVSVTNGNGVSGGLSFSVIERVVGAFAVDSAGTFPKTGAVGVETGTRIKVRFTRELDPASTAKEFFRVTKTAAPESWVPGSFSIFPDGFEFVPSGEWEPSMSYTFTVLSSLRDRAGNALAASYSASFTTAGSTRGSSAIIGKVTDASGASVAGAYIYVFVPQGVPIPYAADASRSYQNYFSRNAKTDADGAFQLSVPPGAYMVEAHPPYDRSDALRAAPREVTITAGETRTVNLTLGSTVKIITGTVLFADGAPVTDAEVGAYASESRQWASSTTDAAGIYVLKVGAGQWFVGIHPRESGRAAWTWNGKPQGATFARDGKEETATRNFIVAASNAVLVVSATDESGAPLENVGVIADTHSGSSIVSGDIGIPPEFRITGTDGTATFALGVRAYFVRGYVPQDRGYVNAAEQEVLLAGGARKEVKLVFKKKQAATQLTISGTTKTEEGIATDAFVWAWSERGGFTSTRADAQGAFSFGVEGNARWHIGAGKEYKGFPYKSPEIVVNVKTTAVVVELLLNKQTLAPLPPSISVSEPGSQQVVAKSADGAQLTLPPSAVSASGDVKVEINPTVEAPTQAGTDVVSTVYDVTIHDATGKEVTTLTKEAEIVIPYDDTDLKKQGVSEDALVPSYFDEKTGVWARLDECTIDKERNVAVCRVDHLTRFAITARADATPPDAPASVAAKPAGVGQISITWKKPVKDFDYIKVYRSAKTGELGTVRAAKLRASAFSDGEGLADGATYYYTVRAVDTAGNESENTAQVSATAKGSSGAKSSDNVATSVSGGIMRALRRGMRGDDVRLLQTILAQEGLLASDSATGFFGPATEAAVKKFQAAAGLEQVGSVGPATRKRINALAP